MAVSGSGAPQREPVVKPVRGGVSSAWRKPQPVLLAARNGHSAELVEASSVRVGSSLRVSLMLTPEGRGSFPEQTGELLSKMEAVLHHQPVAMIPVIQTVFLREPADQAKCERLFSAHYGSNLPVTNFVFQRPCCGAALSLEAWAIGGKSVKVERFARSALAVSYDKVRWVYAAGIRAARQSKGAYGQTLDALGRMSAVLGRAGSGFDHVVRTWFYLGGITDSEAGSQRYKEMNRARTEFYEEVGFSRPLLERDRSAKVYPASTGIGMGGRGLVASCLALQTGRRDAFLVHLENPRQTPAYAYHRKYSPASPKFSRAIALVLDDYVTTWVSGTASIVNSETCHRSDIVRQTEQTIDNIERLIAAENFALHGIRGAGARLQDLAKIRVYVKRPEDFPKCKALCDRRFGPVPAIYAVADVCRPELLVEVEGVAFSRYSPALVRPSPRS